MVIEGLQRRGRQKNYTFEKKISYTRKWSLYGHAPLLEPDP